MICLEETKHYTNAVFYCPPMYTDMYESTQKNKKMTEYDTPDVTIEFNPMIQANLYGFDVFFFTSSHIFLGCYNRKKTAHFVYKLAETNEHLRNLNRMQEKMLEYVLQ